jgi:hypothetical protein
VVPDEFTWAFVFQPAVLRGNRDREESGIRRVTGHVTARVPETLVVPERVSRWDLTRLAGESMVVCSRSHRSSRRRELIGS